MRVRYSPLAFADREQIFDHLHQRSPLGARNVMASIREAVQQLSEHPYSGYQTDQTPIRIKFVTRYPYKIFYRVRDETIEIIHIRHTARHPWQDMR